MSARSASLCVPSAIGTKATAICALIALLVSACTGSSSGEATESSTPATIETPTAETPVTETPSVEPAPAGLSDDERIAAAIAEFDSNPQPEGLFAYDILGASLSGTGVIISLCAWTGETVFDEVRQATYRVSTELDATGEPDATFESTTKTPGECLNTTLVESALQATRDYDNYWRGVLEDPASFNETEALELLAQEFVSLNQRTVNEWASQGVTYLNNNLDAQLPESSVVDVLFRTYTESGVDVLELMACRDLPADFGLYRGDLLIDDFRAGSSEGPHSTDQYLMIRRDNSWKLIGVLERDRVNCFSFDEGWLAGINELLGEPVKWTVVG